jgi:hypothetical protein
MACIIMLPRVDNAIHLPVSVQLLINLGHTPAGKIIAAAA